MCVGRDDGLPVPPVVQPLHPDPLPRVEDDALRVALVEMAALAAASNLVAVGRPRDRRQAVLGIVRDFALDLTVLHVPQADLIGGARNVF